MKIQEAIAKVIEDKGRSVAVLQCPSNPIDKWDTDVDTEIHRFQYMEYHYYKMIPYIRYHKFYLEYDFNNGPIDFFYDDDILAHPSEGEVRVDVLFSNDWKIYTKESIE